MSSSVPLAVPAFISIATAALPAGTQIKMGTQFGVYEGAMALLVTGVRFNQDEIAEMSPAYKHEEHYVINCSLFSTAGDDDHPGRMQDVYSLYRFIMIALASHADLNDTVRVAWTRQLDYTPGFDPKGFQVGQLDFEIVCEARVDPTS